MTKGINKVILVGNLGSDPKISIGKSDFKIVSFSLATSDSWKDKTTGEQKNKTEWHRIVLYKQLAEFASQYIKKGDKVFIEGSLHTHEWINKENIKQVTTEIVGKEIQILSSKKKPDTEQSDDIGNKEDLLNDDIPF